MTEPIPETTCPHCHAVIHGALEVRPDGRGPKLGDVNVCMECYGVSIFTATLGLRRPSLEEVLELKRDTVSWAQIELGRSAIKEVKKKRS